MKKNHSSLIIQTKKQRLHSFIYHLGYWKSRILSSHLLASCSIAINKSWLCHEAGAL